MEEGQCDSDVSDSWSVVDFKSEDAASALKTSSDSGLPADPVISNRQDLADGLDECFELTEVSQPVGDPLGVLASFQTNESRDRDPDSLVTHAERHVGCNESDADTDGISVISEDEEYVNWRQAAHDNYRNTMRLLESSPEAVSRTPPPEIGDSNEQNGRTENMDADTEQQDERTEPMDADKEEQDERTEPMDADPEEETSPPVPEVLSMTQSLVAPDAGNVEQSLVPQEEPWHQNCSHFLTKHLFTSAVIAALACIALSQFLKSGNGKERVAEMLQALEKLRSDNELLKLQLQHLTQAYATLEARVQSAEFPAGLSPQKDTVPTPDNVQTTEHAEKPLAHRAQDLLPLLIKRSQGKDPKLEALATRLHDQFSRLSEDPATQDLKTLEQKIVSCVGKLLKKGASDGGTAVKRLYDLGDRVNKKINHSSRKKRKVKPAEKIDEGLNIIQWYPEGENSESIIREPDLTETSENIDSSSENLVQNEQIKKTKKENSENIPPKTRQSYKDSKKKCKQSNKCEKENSKKGGKYLKEKTKGCEQGRNRTGTWYLERGRGREMTRRAEAEAEVQGEWQFARGRKDLKKEIDEKAMWYLRRFDEQSRSRQ